MRTLESAKHGAARPGVSPDVAATAEVLRALYLPSECRHLVALLGAEEAVEPASDAAFLETVHALLAPEREPDRAAGELQETLWARARFLDALMEEVRRPAAGGGAPRLPDREELARLWHRERYGEGPAGARAVSPAIRHQLCAA